jgi:peptide/nickel transport system substrate-binding protein
MTTYQNDYGMARLAKLIALLTVSVFLSCSRMPDPNTLVMIIESSPLNLDPRVGTDAQSERIGMLMFDALLHRDQNFNLQPSLAERWEIRDALTYVFHLRRGVRFHDGRQLTSRDVKWTFDSLLNGSIRSVKASTYRQVERIVAPDEWTIIFHLKEPHSPLLWLLADGNIGIVPYGSGSEFNRHPVGSGAFRFVHMIPDKEVLIERNPEYWGPAPKLARVRFAVVPDTTTRALELRKGSADVAINALSPDMVSTIERDGELAIERSPGTIYTYLAFNLRDPVLKDVRVRQAIAYALDRQPLIHYLWRDQARPAASLLPPQHWAYNADVPRYEHDPARARQLLDEAGYKPNASGIRFRLAMKTSTEETTRLFAAVLQQQLREVEIELDIRTFEFATFYSDVQKGAFQLHSMRWIGGNEDPDHFEHIFHSASIPPRRANRTYYSNARVDALIEQGRRETDQQKRKAAYAEIQRILAEDLPYVNLWYLDNILVHTSRVRNLRLSSRGDYEFLKTAELAK